MSNKQKETALAVAATTALAAAYSYGEDAGLGLDNQTSEDMSMPYLGVLQAISPEVNGDPGERIKGAVAGNLINTVTKELFDGEQGVIFQPCDTSHVFVEWKPRNQGGGFVAVHQLDAVLVIKAKESQEFGKYKTPDGNDLIETFYVAGLLHRAADINEQAKLPPEPMLMAFTSTKIKSYKMIMTRLRTVKGNPPLFAHRLLVKSASEKNSKGNFSNFHLEPAVDNDVVKSLIPPTLGDGPNPVLLAGKELLKAYRGGAMKVNHEGGAATEKKDADIPF